MTSAAPQPPDVELSPHLRLREVACPCNDCLGRTAPMHRRLLVAYAHWRSHRDSPIWIRSGYRCPKHNGKVGGSENSQHMLGLAIDVYLGKDVDLMSEELLAEIMACGFTGIGRSKTQLHVDTREDPYFWLYLPSGKHAIDAAAMKMFKERSDASSE